MIIIIGTMINYEIVRMITQLGVKVKNALILTKFRRHSYSRTVIIFANFYATHIVRLLIRMVKGIRGQL